MKKLITSLLLVLTLGIFNPVPAQNSRLFKKAVISAFASKDFNKMAKHLHDQVIIMLVDGRFAVLKKDNAIIWLTGFTKDYPALKIEFVKYQSDMYMIFFHTVQYNEETDQNEELIAKFLLKTSQGKILTIYIE